MTHMNRIQASHHDRFQINQTFIRLSQESTSIIYTYKKKRK